MAPKIFCALLLLICIMNTVAAKKRRKRRYTCTKGDIEPSVSVGHCEGSVCAQTWRGPRVRAECLKRKQAKKRCDGYNSCKETKNTRACCCTKSWCNSKIDQAKWKKFKTKHRGLTCKSATGLCSYASHCFYKKKYVKSKKGRRKRKVIKSTVECLWNPKKAKELCGGDNKCKGKSCCCKKCPKSVRVYPKRKKRKN